MRVGVVTGSVSQLAGGLLDCVRSPVLELARRGVEQKVFALRDRQTERELPSWAPLRPEVFCTLGPRFVGFSPGLKQALMKSDVELVHSHGIFLWTSGHVNAWHRRTGKTYVVSPHGMLDPWALRNSRWKKRIAARLFEGRHLHEASCLHALNEAEAEAMRAYGLRQPIAVIPNGVALPAQGKEIEDRRWEIGGRQEVTGYRRQATGKRKAEIHPSTTSDLPSAKKLLLFLGRLHPKKGLAELIEAWAKTGQRKDWTLVIAGWGDPAYVDSLKSLARERGLSGAPGYRLQAAGGRAAEGEICFVGPVFGEEKQRLLANADGFVLSSHSEGLPVAVLEAWSQAVPVVMTAECNLPEGFRAGAALEVKLRPASGKLSLAEGLEKLVTMKDDQRREMGLKGRKLVEERFIWPEVAGQFLETYKWILGETKNRPTFVRV